MKRAGGFTLVEVLVVMALLSLLMLALGGSMRSIAGVEERLDARTRSADELRVAMSFLGATLERVSARKGEAPAAVGVSPFLFEGHAQAIAWVGVMPARHGAGGRNFFRLSVEPGPQGASALVLRFVPWQGTAAWPDWSTAQSRVLLAQVAVLRLAYAEDAVPTIWEPEWTEVKRMPDRVRLSLATAATAWPDVTIPLRALPLSDGGRGGFVFGPE